jgi:hypothetical protein
MKKTILWQVLVWATAAVAVWGARKATRAAWSKVSDSDNPENPFDESTTWAEAISMAAMLALAAFVARKVARRGAERAWTVATGEAPPGAAV